MVIPHSYSYIHCICLKEEVHITYLIDPLIETVFSLALELENEVYKLFLGCSKVFFVALELIGVVDSIVLIPVESVAACAVQICRTIRTVYAFP